MRKAPLLISIERVSKRVKRGMRWASAPLLLDWVDGKEGRGEI